MVQSHAAHVKTEINENFSSLFLLIEIGNLLTNGFDFSLFVLCFSNQKKLFNLLKNTPNVFDVPLNFSQDWIR